MESEPTPVPLLDHVFLTVPEKTVEAITGCEFLAGEQFGRFRVKEAVSTLIGPYRTANVAGVNTFVEFFPDSSPPFPSVTAGLVLSFDRPGASARARQRLADHGYVCHHELVRRAVDGADQPQPWYHLVRPEFGADSPFTLFLSEITPEYFARLGAEPGPGGTQDRGAYLAAAMRGAQAPDHLLDDVIGVTVRLSDKRADLLAGILRALGYEGGDDLSGPGATVHIVRGNDEPERVLGVRLRLRRPHPRVFSLGETMLRLSPGGPGDATADWDLAAVGTATSGGDGGRHG